MSSQPIGVFDSGLGGLTAVKQLRSIMPHENIIYFGDTGRVPYGNRSVATISRYAKQDARFLLSHNVKMVIAACGTVSSTVLDLADVLPVPYINVISPTAYAAVQATKNGKIGVIGTRATIGSCAYKKEIEKIDPNITVIQRDCPLFVPIVEEGFISPDDEIAKLSVEHYLSDIKACGVDTIILGCTHYPLLKPVIGQYVGEDVKLIDSGKETAIYASKLLEREGLLNSSDAEGECAFFVSDRTEDFTNTASIFLHSNIGDNVERVDIWTY
ncbi:MAG: glutamate racemase [Clostridia bacterium]|nr:glutamate racemase [Clostridia bacterium]